MEPEAIAIMTFNGFLAGGLAALVCTRMNRLENHLEWVSERLSDQVAGCATRAELKGLGDHVAGCATRPDLNELRAEMAAGFTKQGTDITALRSDLTQIALAVGARAPRSAEG